MTLKSSVKIYGETQGPGNALHCQGPVTRVGVSGVASSSSLLPSPHPRCLWASRQLLLLTAGLGLLSVLGAQGPQLTATSVQEVRGSERVGSWDEHGPGQAPVLG